ncbi:hypothetical protein HK097_004784 [Rhizophlyctis rosea]|uniref:FAD/NAD(P)-binding domain-containing protein n=1 Tax=Rhizophlyctis rosea TaxID=64517 RepID=A0AAD5S153_9FUNG|nr:hypothetical protein HK097_004784 [Rhizophlyctis rosea]
MSNVCSALKLWLSTFFPSAPEIVAVEPMHHSEYKNIVVIGGAWCAMRLAQAVRTTPLPKGYRLIIIDKNSHFHYQFAFPRASVLDGFENELFIPYTKLFRSANEGVVVTGTVTEITPTSVKLSTVIHEFQSDTIPYQYLVYATGTQQTSPCYLAGANTKASGIAYLKAYQRKLADASKIVIIGGGAVGIELAAEIKEHFPEKEVTLVHSRERYLLRYAPKLSQRVYEILDNIGVRQILGERVSVPEGGFVEGKMTTLKLSKSGQEIESDLQIMCVGGKANSALLTTLSPTIVDKCGRVKVKPTMQIEDDRYPNVFAAGDVTNTEDPNSGGVAWKHGDVIYQNILKMIAAKESGAPTTPLTNHVIVIPQIILYLGLYQGAAQMVVFGRPILLPNFLIKRFFTRNVGADRIWAWMNQTMDPASVQL